MQARSAMAFVGLSMALILVFLAMPQVIFGQDRTPRDTRIPGQYIVVFKDEVKDADAAEQNIVSRVHGEHLASYRSVLNGFAARFSESDLAAITNDPRVAFVSEDREVSIADSTGSRQADSRRPRTDPVQALDEFMRNLASGRTRGGTPPPEPAPSPSPSPAPPSSPPPSGDSPSPEAVSTQLQAPPTGINRINAEGLANTGAGVDVAVIDTGILASHSDLSGKVVGGKNCTKASGGYSDQNGHGTHVAGTIAALNNSFGVVGVAPGAKLWSVRVLDKNGSGSWSTVICGLDFVTSKAPKNGGTIKVANLSLGGGGVSDNNCGNSNNDALHKAICRARDAGVTIVVAAGNSGADAATFVPAAYDDAVITVSALADSDGKTDGLGAGTSYGADDTFASFSNWGTPVDIGAPGVSIYSTWLSNSYMSLSGTSMASPHVAGAAALYIAKHPAALWSEVRDALIAQGEALGAGHTDPGGKHPEKVLRADIL